MKPDSNQSTDYQLPPPATPPVLPDQLIAGQEAAPAAEHLEQTGLAPLSLPLPPVAATTPVAGTQNPAADAIDDQDLIEKEWVNKAKEIVEQNRNDPFKQAEELTVFRADYMKKRYDKNIKLSQ